MEQKAHRDTDTPYASERMLVDHGDSYQSRNGMFDLSEPDTR